jgi:hypothetical protein
VAQKIEGEDVGVGPLIPANRGRVGQADLEDVDGGFVLCRRSRESTNC